MIDHSQTHYTAPCGQEIQQLDANGRADSAASVHALQQHMADCPACAQTPPVPPAGD